MAASRIGRWPSRLVAGLVWFHRWLGIATCLVFAAWFASGAVLLFQPFPSLPKREAAAMARAIDADAVRVSPAEALRRVGAGTAELRLVQRAGQPAYLAVTPTGPVAIDARTGSRLDLLDARQAARLAPGGAPVEATGPFGYDQWIVHSQFDPLRPFYRLVLRDEAGTELYVSAATGEFVQRTTWRERTWNWVGAVLHWVYVTPLRSRFVVWDRTVWWLSLVAMLVAIAGTALGVIRTLAVKRAGRHGLSFFRQRWLRWHHLLGLFASIFVLGWILSGWLSMDHGRLFARGRPTTVQQAHYAGLPLGAAVANTPATFARSLPTAKSVAFTALAGTPVLAVTEADGTIALFTPSGRRIRDADRDRLLRTALAAAWPEETIGSASMPAPTDLYVLAEGMPDTAAVYPLGRSGTSVYVDTATGAILTVMDRSRAAYAWTYYALHTFNFPGLTGRPVLRKILVLVPLLLGFLFSITGVVIGYRRLRRSFRSPVRPGVRAHGVGSI